MIKSSFTGARAQCGDIGKELFQVEGWNCGSC